LNVYPFLYYGLKTESGNLVFLAIPHRGKKYRLVKSGL